MTITIRFRDAGFRLLFAGWVLLLLLSVPTLPLAAEETAPAVFRVGYFDLPPHAFAETESGRRGPAIDYFRLVAARMGLSAVDFKQYPLARLLQELEADRIDMILFLARNDERAARFRYPETPFFDMQPVLVLPIDHPLAAITSAEDLLTLRIGVYLDGYHAPMIKDPRLHLEAVAGDDLVKRSYEMMAAGRIDAFFSPDLESVRFEAARNGRAKAVKFLPLPDSSVGLYAVFSQKSGADYAARYVTALAETRRELPYADFLNRELTQ